MFYKNYIQIHTFNNHISVSHMTHIQIGISIIRGFADDAGEKKVE